MGDAAHVMTPFRSEGGFNTFIDAMNLGKRLAKLNAENKVDGIAAIKEHVTEYNDKMLERGRKSVRLSRQWVDGSKVKQKQPLQAPMKVIPFKELPTQLVA
ncbi:hypothetical protein ACHAPJ_012079 [Fusarium lateritium]